MSNEAKMLNGINVDSEIFNELVNKTTEIMKLSIIQSIMSESNPKKCFIETKTSKFNNISNQNKSVGAVVTERYKKMTPEVKNIVMRNIRSIKSTEPQIISRVVSSGLNVAKGPRIIDQIDLKKEYAFLATKDQFGKLNEDLMDILEKYGHGHGGLGGGSNGGTTNDDNNPSEPDTPPIIINKGLWLNLHSVKCLDETDPEWPGSDEISMGGVTLDDKNAEAAINEFEVYNDFDDNEVKSYNPPMVLKQFNLDSSYPKTFSAFIVLAEKDNGGFSRFISELYNAIKDELSTIVTALGAAAGAAIGIQIGGTIGAVIGGPIGVIIGVAAGAILGALTGWLVSALSDDIFPTQMTTVTLPSGNSTFENSALQSPIMRLFYEAHGGKYEVRYNWQIVR